MSIFRRGVAGLLIAALALVTGPSSVAAKPRVPEITCAACLLVDDAGRELFARNAGQLLPNASTTKMTTALVVLAHADPSESVRVSQTAAGTGGGGLDLSPDAVYPVDSLLRALLLTSSNDAAVALAEHVAETEAAFVEQMNAFAARIGATDTHYVTAHGLDTPGHGSSARDLALIAARLLDEPLLREMVGQARTTIPGPGGEVLLENRNLLLEGYRGATGVKTGFTADAGNVLVASAERGGRRLIAVAMDSVDATADARALLDFGWERLEATVLLAATAPVGTLVFDQGSTAVVADAPVRGPHDPDSISLTLRPHADLRMPIDPGEIVGQVSITVGDTLIDTVDGVALEAVASAEEGWAAGAVAELLRFAGSLVGTR